MKNRLFIALHIPEYILDRIFSIRDELYPKDNLVKWEEKSKLHITLKFLGDNSEVSIEDITNSLDQILSNYSELELAFDKFGIFKHIGTPKILWTGLSDNNFLTKLVAEINKEFENLGFEKEKRKFNSHLTLLRIRGRENFNNIAKFAGYDFKNLHFRGNKISLFESNLLKSGSIYNTIKSFELKNITEEE